MFSITEVHAEGGADAIIHPQAGEPLAPRPYGPVDVVVLAVTSETAAALLTLGRDRRRAIETAAIRLMTDLVAETCHSPVFAVHSLGSEYVLDRLQDQAVIARTGKTHGMNLPSEESETDLEGAAVRPPESLKDFLRARKKTGAPGLAAALIGIQKWEAGDRRQGLPAPTASVEGSIELLRRHPEVETIARDAAAYARHIPSITATDLSCLVWAFDRAGGVRQRRDFFAQVKSGANLPAGHPILALRAAFHQELIRRKAHREEMIAIICLAWNAVREGRDVDTLAYRAGGAEPDPFPEPA